jgi:dipeptidase D
VTDLLANLEPKPLWRYFLELSRIPRASKQEAAAAAWVVAQARALGCQVEQDQVGNILIRKAASPGREGRPVVAMQAHVDMVCEKNEGTAHDFAKDPIQVRRDGDVLRATGTTLGADNGIGVASALAALADPDLKHGPLEVLITVDEETGMTGAKGLGAGWLKASMMLNLDSEEEGELTIGCAGGIDTTCTRKLSPAAPRAGTVALRLKVSGLKGGHSGIDIAAGRGNSLRILAQALDRLLARYPLGLASVAGGNKRNAIAREASAVIFADPRDEAGLKADVARMEVEWRAAFGALDPGVAVTLEPGNAEWAMSAADARAVVGLLLAGPHGVEAMSPDIKGLVQTSTNMGLVETRAGEVEVNFLSRSSIDASKYALAARIGAIAALCGFEARDSNGYPGWKPEPGSGVVKLVQQVHAEVFGKAMEVKAIHAGLECGLIRENYGNVEMASIGPSMWDVHTPDEHVSIPSVASFWKLLKAILEKV